MTDTTRDILLKQLADLKISGAAELAGRLGITSAAARYHLARLRAAGQIEEITPSSRSRGRPQHLYRLPVRASPDNLPGLCLALIQLVNSEPVAPTPLILWDRLAERLAETLVPDLASAPSALPSGRLDLLRRLNQAVSRLDTLNYQAAWEAGPRGPRLRLNNCPYALIWPDAPQLCQMDSALLARLLGVPVRLLAHRAFTSPGTSSCLFEVET